MPSSPAPCARAPSSPLPAPRRPHRFPFAGPRGHAGAEAMVMRTGSEPATARSPLRMRLWLSVWGMAWAVCGLVAFVATGRAGWATACAVLLVVTVTDLCVVVHRMRQGSAFQPGRNVPPYGPGRDRRRRRAP
ncbi:DUF6343 family protein [Streptomyces sp. NPDC102402]|uniref:DUF6343 family protein n=1 Tax=Streptomyces sp. NPDC102402 TaxID=3366169 RepID=UPI00381857F0